MSYHQFISISLTYFLLLAVTALGMDDHEHAKILKDFVPDHPHLHDLVDKTHEGDLDAKSTFERESLSARFKMTKENLPPDTDAEHVVLHFLDDYTTHVTGGISDHKFMELEPLISMLDNQDDMKIRLIELGKMLEKAECDFTCLGDRLTLFMNDSVAKLIDHTEL